MSKRKTSEERTAEQAAIEEMWRRVTQGLSAEEIAEKIRRAGEIREPRVGYGLDEEEQAARALGGMVEAIGANLDRSATILQRLEAKLGSLG